MSIRPALPTSFQTAGTGHPVRTGIPCPVIAKTDGECLILKGVRFLDGKRYDVRIWRWDEDGNAIAINQHTAFSGPALAQIQKIVGETFSFCGDPTKSKIFYCDVPEMSQSLTDGAVTDLIAGGYTEIVTRARRIHQLLIPEARMDWSSDPRAKMLIYPELLTPEEIAALKKADDGSANGAPPAKKFKTGTDAAVGAPDVVTGSTDVTTSTPSSKPLPGKAKRQKQELDKEETIERLNKAAAEFSEPRPFLKDVTYSELVDYAVATSKAPTDKLYPAYEAYKAVVADPKLAKLPTDVNAEDARQMKDWLKWLYLSAYRLRKEQEEFMQFFSEDAQKSFSGSFDDYCKHNAADSVVSNVRLESQDVEPLKDELKQTPIPTSLNI